jgi:hypothetical protein
MSNILSFLSPHVTEHNTGNHNLCHTKTNLRFLCIFLGRIQMLLELLYHKQLSCDNFLKCNFSEISFFFVPLPICFKYGWGTLHILNIVCTWTLNHNKDSKHVSPITDSLTVQTQTCTDRLGHETHSKFCLRNTALLVVCCTALVASVVCSFYWSVLCKRIVFSILSSCQGSV